MEENQKEEKIVDTEELKKETAETVNQVKDTIKNVDIKNDAKEATSFAKKMFSDPFGAIKEIVNDSSNKQFKTAIIFVVLWTVAVFVDAFFAKYWSFRGLFKNVLSLVKTVIAPALGIVVLSTIIYIMNKENKKSLITTITAITIAKIPVVVAAVVGLLDIIGSGIYKITSPFSALCSTISIVLTFFAAKQLCGEEECSKFIKKFVVIEGIFYIAYIVVSYLGIYMR